jgi:cytochrome P450
VKEVPPEGDTIHGHFVPGGTRIGTAALALQRSKDMFGVDVDVFRPERWLNIDADKKREMVQIVDMVFGYGRWGCAGKPVAFIELNKIYIEVSEVDIKRIPRSAIRTTCWSLTKMINPVVSLL